MKLKNGAFVIEDDGKTYRAEVSDSSAKFLMLDQDHKLEARWDVVASSVHSFVEKKEEADLILKEFKVFCEFYRRNKKT